MSRSPFVRCGAFLAVLGLLALAPSGGRADYPEEQLKADLKLFEDAKLPHGDKDLLDSFRSRLLSDEDRARLEGLVKMMSSKVFKEREQARIDLEKFGPPALPVLRKVLQGDFELEVKQRAERSIKAIEQKSPNTLVMAAARLLAHRQSEGALTVLMDYVAVAPDEAVEEEICNSIYNLALVGLKLRVLPPAVKAGKLDQRIVPALADKNPTRRAIAALIVARYGDAQQRQAVAKLLTDPDPAVRFRAAQGLTVIHNPAGIAVLVELLDNGPMSLAIQAEDLLNQIAGEKSPQAALGDSKEQRQKCQAAWKEWWAKNKGDIDLSKAEIDAPFGGMAARASKGATHFINVLLGRPKLDLAAMAKVTDVPFTFFGQMTFNTRQELDNFLMQITMMNPPQDFKFKVIKVVPAAAYVKTSSNENERAFLQGARLAQIHIVYIEGTENGRPETIPFFIRLSGGRARCIGLGLPDSAKQ